mgnify:CR=1 FL=1
MGPTYKRTRILKKAAHDLIAEFPHTGKYMYNLIAQISKPENSTGLHISIEE